MSAQSLPGDAGAGEEEHGGEAGRGGDEAPGGRGRREEGRGRGSGEGHICGEDANESHRPTGSPGDNSLPQEPPKQGKAAAPESGQQQKTGGPVHGGDFDAQLVRVMRPAHTPRQDRCKPVRAKKRPRPAGETGLVEVEEEERPDREKDEVAPHLPAMGAGRQLRLGPARHFGAPFGPGRAGRQAVLVRAPVDRVFAQVRVG